MSPFEEKCIINDSINVFKDYYKLVKPKEYNENIESYGVRKSFLIFYENSKIGWFLDYDDENFDFDPRKAEMCYFGKKNEKCFIKYKTSFQGHYSIEQDEIVFLDKDSVLIYTPNQME